MTGDVRVNGEIISDSDKTNHVEVMPKSRDSSEGFDIKFKVLKCGISKEVKLTRRKNRASFIFGTCTTPYENPVSAEIVIILVCLLILVVYCTVFIRRLGVPIIKRLL